MRFLAVSPITAGLQTLLPLQFHPLAMNMEIYFQNGFAHFKQASFDWAAIA